MDSLLNYYNPATSSLAPLISETTHSAVVNNAERLNAAINHQRDYNYNYFGFKVSCC